MAASLPFTSDRNRGVRHNRHAIESDLGFSAAIIATEFAVLMAVVSVRNMRAVPSRLNPAAAELSGRQFASNAQF